MKKEVKFCQTKAFRNAFAIILAVLVFILLSRNVVGSAVSLITEVYEAMQWRSIAERVVQRAGVVTVEPQTDEEIDPDETLDETLDETPDATPDETLDETPDPNPEATETPDLDSTAQIELDQPGSGELIKEDIGEELPIDDPAVGFPLDEELPTVERSVSVRRVMSDIVRDGDLFRVEATLVGFDGIVYELQWQYNDGTGWQDVPDANGATTLELIADQYNVNYDWRVLATIIQTLIIESTTIE